MNGVVELVGMGVRTIGRVSALLIQTTPLKRILMIGVERGIVNESLSRLWLRGTPDVATP